MVSNPLNAVNRGVYISDNLPFLQSLNDECVDLVCIDPPFAKNDTFGQKNAKSADPLKPPLTEAELKTERDLLKRWGITNQRQADEANVQLPQTAYKDIWSWEKDVHEDWHKRIEAEQPAIYSLIEATRMIHGDRTAAYLCYMAVRLLEIKRVLKNTGSLYLHCDHTAGAYLRQLLDAIFGNGESGKAGFRNEIAWCYTGPSNTKRWFPRKHDTILWYSKGREWTFDANGIRVPYAESSKNRFAKQYNESGSAAIWRSNPHEGMVERMSSGVGKIPEDWWPDITPVGRIKDELTGYPTQKPVALAERIIKASCTEDGVVLDCFAGCAYVAIAAEKLGRSWVACDINPRAWTVFKRQFHKARLFTPNAPPICVEPHDLPKGWQPYMFSNVVTVHGPTESELPTPSVRTEIRASEMRPLPRPPYKIRASIIPEPEMLALLLEISDYKAWCCGFANRKPDGTVIKTRRNFHLDHIAPISKDGTSHEIQNRAPMCPYHNIHKGNRRIALSEYREEIAANSELMVDSIEDLNSLTEALAIANRIYGEAYARQNRQRPLAGMSMTVLS